MREYHADFCLMIWSPLFKSTVFVIMGTMTWASQIACEILVRVQFPIAAVATYQNGLTDVFVLGLTYAGFLMANDMLPSMG